MTWSTFWSDHYWVPETKVYSPKLKKSKPIKPKNIKPTRKGCWL